MLSEHSAANITIRSYSDADYDMVSSWWAHHARAGNAVGDSLIPREALPRSGFVVEVDGVPAYCAWVYESDSCICWFEWFVRNPAAPRSRGALQALLACMIGHAKARGFRVAFANVRNPALVSQLCAAGFTIDADRTMTGMTRPI